MSQTGNPTLLLDRVEGSRASIRKGRNVIVRVAFASDIDSSAPSTTMVRFLSVAGMPQLGEAHPANTGTFVTGYDVRPAGPTQAFIDIIYENPEVGGTPLERMSVADTSTLSSEVTQLLPPEQGLKQLLVSTQAKDPAYDALDDGTIKVASVNYPQILRNRICYGLFTEPRPATWRKCLRYVNGAKFMDLKQGYWLCTFYDEKWSDTDRKWRVTVAFTTKQDTDWSSYAVMRGTDGQYAQVPVDVTDSLRVQDYAPGIVYQQNSLLKVGMFLRADFDNIFGKFIVPPDQMGQFNGTGF